MEFLAQLAPVRDAAHPEVLEVAARYIEGRLRDAGAAVSAQPYAVGGVRFRNVIGVLGNPRGPSVIVGAHYDACGMGGPNPGADDNASGVAGLLELARLLAPLALPVRVELVAYSTEEPPHFATDGMGSAVHAASVAAAPPRAMISLEMIGYFSDAQRWPSPLLSLTYPNHGRFIGIVGRPADRALVAHLKSSLGGALDAAAYTGPAIPGVDFSDHRSYWQHGIPAAMVTDTAFFRNPNYHAAGDLPATLDYARMGRVVDGLVSALRNWP